MEREEHGVWQRGLRRRITPAPRPEAGGLRPVVTEQRGIDIFIDDRGDQLGFMTLTKISNDHH